MKWRKPILIVAAGLLAIAAIVPFFVSVDDYIPRIEEAVAAALNEPVSITRMKVAVLPLPHATIEGITVGKTGDITLGKVTVNPELLSLLRPVTVIRSIEVDSLVLTRKALDALVARSSLHTTTPPQVRVEKVRFTNALVDLGKTRFGPFDARADLDGDGNLVDASIATLDGKLKVLVKPGNPGYRIDARAKSWMLPFDPALVFDELTVRAMVTKKDADFGEVRARLYGGTAIGKATVAWHKGLQLNGSFDLSRLEMQHLAPLLLPGTRVSGRLNAKPVFSASAASADRLPGALRMNTDFAVQNGVLRGVDIRKAATNLIRQGASGGETRFERLSGHLAMQQSRYRFTQLRIASGALAADGRVTVSPAKTLSGRINAQVTLAGASAKVPLNVAGTVAAPQLYPTGGTVAGAAVGTAILGPGIGTSVGARIGGWAENLFDGKDEK